MHNLILGAKVSIPKKNLVCGVEMATFKLPSLSKKRRRPLELPEFSRNPIMIKEELGSGTFPNSGAPNNLQTFPNLGASNQHHHALLLNTKPLSRWECQ